MEKRPLGKTSETLSLVGFGGMILMDEEPAAAARLVAQAVERGINYFDVAPLYGNAEERLGPALEPYRKAVFLACKTHARSRDGAWAELRRSLQRLRTDYLDLYQLHEMLTLGEVDLVTRAGGALEAFVEARRQGLVRYLGFSAHSEEAALALLDRFDFDTVLFPVNYVLWHQGNFGPAIMARAQEKGAARLAIKALAKRPWVPGEARPWPKCWYSPVDTPEEAALALRFTLSRPVTAAVSPSYARFLWWACDVADRFQPLTPEEEAEVARRSAGLRPILPDEAAQSAPPEA